MSKPENPPAFPRIGGFENRYGQLTAQGAEPGMSLRDYFAANAMQGLVARKFTVDEHDRPFVEWVTQLSYEFADEMLKARQS